MKNSRKLLWLALGVAALGMNAQTPAHAWDEYCDDSGSSCGDGGWGTGNGWIDSSGYDYGAGGGTDWGDAFGSNAGGIGQITGGGDWGEPNAPVVTPFVAPPESGSISGNDNWGDGGDWGGFSAADSGSSAIGGSSQQASANSNEGDSVGGFTAIPPMPEPPPGFAEPSKDFVLPPLPENPSVAETLPPAPPVLPAPPEPEIASIFTPPAPPTLPEPPAPAVVTPPAVVDLASIFNPPTFAEPSRGFVIPSAPTVVTPAPEIPEPPAANDPTPSATLNLNAIYNAPAPTVVPLPTIVTLPVNNSNTSDIMNAGDIEKLIDGVDVPPEKMGPPAEPPCYIPDSQGNLSAAFDPEACSKPSVTITANETWQRIELPGMPNIPPAPTGASVTTLVTVPAGTGQPPASILGEGGDNDTPSYEVIEIPTEPGDTTARIQPPAPVEVESPPQFPFAPDEPENDATETKNPPTVVEPAAPDVINLPVTAGKSLNIFPEVTLPASSNLPEPPELTIPTSPEPTSVLAGILGTTLVDQGVKEGSEEDLSHTCSQYAGNGAAVTVGTGLYDCSSGAVISVTMGEPGSTVRTNDDTLPTMPDEMIIQGPTPTPPSSSGGIRGFLTTIVNTMTGLGGAVEGSLRTIFNTGEINPISSTGASLQSGLPTYVFHQGNPGGAYPDNTVVSQVPATGENAKPSPFGTKPAQPITVTSTPQSGDTEAGSPTASLADCNTANSGCTTFSTSVTGSANDDSLSAPMMAGLGTIVPVGTWPQVGTAVSWAGINKQLPGVTQGIIDEVVGYGGTISQGLQSAVRYFTNNGITMSGTIPPDLYKAGAGWSALQGSKVPTVFESIWTFRALAGFFLVPGQAQLIGQTSACNPDSGVGCVH